MFVDRECAPRCTKLTRVALKRSDPRGGIRQTRKKTDGLCMHIFTLLCVFILHILSDTGGKKNEGKFLACQRAQN